VLQNVTNPKCLRKNLNGHSAQKDETAEIMLSWPLERSGLSAFVGDAINQPRDRSGDLFAPRSRHPITVTVWLGQSAIVVW
jgi:hypothetical protein